MPRRTIDQLQTGMVLAEAATGPRGNVLLGEGVELTERHIRALKTWGISAVKIEGDEDEAAAAAVDLSPELLAAAEDVVAPRFLLSGRDGPVMSLLFAHAVRLQALVLKQKSA